MKTEKSVCCKVEKSTSLSPIRNGYISVVELRVESPDGNRETFFTDDIEFTNKGDYCISSKTKAIRRAFVKQAMSEIKKVKTMQEAEQLFDEIREHYVDLAKKLGLSEKAVGLKPKKESVSEKEKGEK